MKNFETRLRYAFHRASEKIKSLEQTTIIYASACLLGLLILIALPIYVVPAITEYIQAQKVKATSQELKQHIAKASQLLSDLEKVRESEIQITEQQKQSFHFFPQAIAQEESYTDSQLASYIDQAEKTVELSTQLLNEVRAIREDTIAVQTQIGNPNRYIDENLYLEAVESIQESEDSISATGEMAAFYSEYGQASVLFSTAIARVEIRLQRKENITDSVEAAGLELDNAIEILNAINKNEAYPDELRKISTQTQQSYAQLDNALTRLTQLSQANPETQILYLQREIVDQLVLDYADWQQIEAQILDQPTIEQFHAKAQELTQKIDQTNKNQPSDLQVVVRTFIKEENVYVVGKTESITPTATPTITITPTTPPIQINDLGITINNLKTQLVIKAGESQSAFTIASIGSSGISMYGYPTSYGPGINWNISSAGLVTGRSVEIKVQVNKDIPPGTYKGNVVIISYPSQKKHTIPNFEVTVEKASTANPTTTPNPTSSNLPTSTPSTNPPTATIAPTQASLGLQLSTSSVDLTIEDGKSVKAFDITSTGATGFSLYGYPTTYGPGINWSVSSGGITPGSSTSVNIQVNSGINPATYSGTAIVKNQNGVQLSIPVKITVVRTQASRYVKITSPNGGETLKVGDTVTIQWEGNDIDKCSIGYSFGPGSLNTIASLQPTTGNGSYSWTVNIGNTTNTQVKIDLLCYKTGVGQVSDQSDNFFTVNP